MFLCHVNDVKLNSYIVLKQFNNEKVLVSTTTGYKLISNVCPHQQSLLTTCNGRGGRVCPYHGWSFDIDGNNLGSGTTSNCTNDKPLKSEPVYEWNNMLFSVPIHYNYEHNLSNMELVEARVDTVIADYRNVVDLFLDVDHIPLIHKGVYEVIGLSNITSVDWEYFQNGSMQIVERTDISYNDHLIPEDIDKGAFWLTVYPNTMIEWQPGGLFITVAIGNNQVVVFKYNDNRYTKHSCEINTSVWEQAWFQDKEQAEKIVSFTDLHLCEAKRQYRNYLSLTCS